MKKAFVLAAAFIAAFFVSQAKAQIRMELVPFAMACGPHEELLAVIKDKHEERLIGRGLNNADGLAELYVSAEGGWSFILTPKPGQITCVLINGNHWQIVDGEDAREENSAEW